MFAIPWRERTVLGTTDTDFTGTADEVAADAADVKYLCESGNGYFPGANLTPEGRDRDLGRPAPADRRAAERRRVRDLARARGVHAQRRPGDHRRRQAHDVPPHGARGGRPRRSSCCATSARTRRPRSAHDEGRARCPARPASSQATSRASPRSAASSWTSYGLDVDTATHLCGVYGMRALEIADTIDADRALGERLDPELPYVWAEIDFAATRDLARTVDDVLARRVPLLLSSRDQGLGVVRARRRRLAERPRLGRRAARARWSTSIAPRSRSAGAGGRRHRRRRPCRRRRLARGRADRLLLTTDRARARHQQLLDPHQPFEHVLVHLVGLLVEVRDLELGLEVDLVLDVAADPVARALAVRAEQEQRRQDDRLERDAMVSRPNGNSSNPPIGGTSRLKRDPRREEDHVDEQERDAAREVRDPVRDAQHDAAAIAPRPPR